MSSHDVAIIGYGPVGVTAANLLGRMGLRVVVIERDADVYSRARAISTDEEILRIWQRIGLADELTADMLGGRELTFVDSRGRTFLAFTPRGFGNGHPPQQFIYQPAVERTLRAGVARYPNVEVRLGEECVDLVQDTEGVELTVASGERFRASYVIAADGGSSPTRHRLGIGFEGRTFEERWVVVDTRVRTPWPDIDRLRFHCDPARPAVDCPTPLGHHRWEFPVLPGDDEAVLASPDGVRALLAGQGIGDEHVEVLRAVVYSHHVRFADRWRVGRVFLAGDAAHVMPPWIGQGMASGVRDVDNLCWKLAAAVSGQLADAESLLDSYETERMPHVRAITRAAVFFGRVITERRAAVTPVRDAVFRAISVLPGAGSYLRDGGWFPATRYRRGFLGPGGGEHLPQPWVQDGAGRRARLDDVLGHTEWAVLHVGRDTGSDAWCRAGVQVVRVLPAGSEPTPGAVVDVENVLVGWLRRRRITTVAVRPDSIVHSAGVDLAGAPPLRLVSVGR